MVEFAVTLGLFLLIVLAIFEFVLMIMAFSRANEVTRDIARLAVVSNPIVEIDTSSCETDSESVLGSWPNDEATDTDTLDALVARAELHIPGIEDTQVQVNYRCSGGPSVSVIVSVSLVGLEYDLVIPRLFNFGPTINMPAFTTHRTGESLETLNRPP